MPRTVTVRLRRLSSCTPSPTFQRVKHRLQASAERVSEYSTLAEPPHTHDVRPADASISRSLAVNTFCETPPMDCLSSLKRFAGHQIAQHQHFPLVADQFQRGLTGQAGKS